MAQVNFGTTQSFIATKPEGAQRTRIVYPAPGQIIALDPDIPGAQQRVLFRASAPVAAGAWHLDEQILRKAAEAQVFMWEPQVGRHVLSLHAADGSELDKVEFQVRGVQSKN